jgi:hypothetical protein
VLVVLVVFLYTYHLTRVSCRIIEMGSGTICSRPEASFSIDRSAELGWTVDGQNETNTFCLRFTVLAYYWHKAHKCVLSSNLSTIYIRSNHSLSHRTALFF